MDMLRYRSRKEEMGQMIERYLHQSKQLRAVLL